MKDVNTGGGTDSQRIWGQERLQWEEHGQVWPEHQLFEGS